MALAFFRHSRHDLDGSFIIVSIRIGKRIRYPLVILSVNGFRLGLPLFAFSALPGSGYRAAFGAACVMPIFFIGYIRILMGNEDGYGLGNRLNPIM
jgi:hypothetical protein